MFAKSQSPLWVLKLLSEKWVVLVVDTHSTSVSNGLRFQDHHPVRTISTLHLPAPGPSQGPAGAG